MAVRIVQLGSPRVPGEGTRIGTVRRPPRGVPKTEFATQNWFDSWFPLLAPSAELMKQGQAVETDADWQAFAKAYRREMAEPAAAQSVALPPLAAAWPAAGCRRAGGAMTRIQGAGLQSEGPGGVRLSAGPVAAADQAPQPPLHARALTLHPAALACGAGAG